MDSHDSAYGYAHSCYLLKQKNTEQNKKAQGAKALRHEGPLPME